MDDIMKKILAIILRGMEAQTNCGIQAMQMQAIKGRMPNWQAQQFMTNNNQALLGFGLQAPNILSGTMPAPQGNNELAQLIELAKASDNKKSDKSDIRIVKLEKNFAALSKSIEAIADALPKK